MVGATIAGRARSFNVHHLLDMGRLPGTALLFRSISVAILLARTFRLLAPQLVWRQTRLVARLADLFSCVADPLGAGRISSHVLLLPRRVLQSILGRPAVVHGQRTAQSLSRRSVAAADPAKCPPLLSLPRADLHRRAGPGRV